MVYENYVHRFRRWLDVPSADKKALMADTRWVDGLRGIASLFVVASHLVMCFARQVVLPCCYHDTGRPLLWQRPFFRLIGMGHSWVAIFFLLLGFVNALKPLKLARQHRPEAALSNLAISSFRRMFRLVLPAAAATIISWFLCQLGLYETARNSDAFWMYSNTPAPSESWFQAIKHLIRSLKETWIFQGTNAYDQPQWAMMHLLQASVMVFAALLITVNLTPMWRSISFLIFLPWSLDWSWPHRDPLVGVCVFSGLLLSELSLSDLPLRLSYLSPILSPLFIISGLFFMSQPADFVDKANWSLSLYQFAQRHFPVGATLEIHRAWGSFGASLLVLGILLSPHCRRWLAIRPLAWLGRVSFPIYLLHGTFIRTILAWLAFRSTPVNFESDDGPILRYPQRSEPAIYFALTIFLAAVFGASHVWTLKVEPIFARITKSAEALMTGSKPTGAAGSRGGGGMGLGGGMGMGMGGGMGMGVGLGLGGRSGSRDAYHSRARASSSGFSPSSSPNLDASANGQMGRGPGKGAKLTPNTNGRMVLPFADSHQN